MMEQSSSIPTSAATCPVEKASLTRRFFAYAIDSVIVSFAGGFASLLSGYEQAQGWSAVLWGIIALAVPALYFIWPYSTGGQTLGKHLLKIKVISIDGSPLNWRKGVLRSVGYILSGMPFGLGFMWPIWDADRGAWHDKIAGTVVVPALVAREQLQGTIEPSEVRRRQRRWLLGLGIPALLMVIGFYLLIQTGISEVREMGPWPDPEVSPEVLVNVDLSHLGLRAGQLQNARDQETWAEGGYEDGALLIYEVGPESFVAVWALRYETKWAARSDYNSAEAWAQGSCRLSIRANIGNTGLIRCQLNNGFDKVFWKDYWIVNIVALEGAELTPDVLVDQVRDAIAAHWRANALASH